MNTSRRGFFGFLAGAATAITGGVYVAEKSKTRALDVDVKVAKPVELVTGTGATPPTGIIGIPMQLVSFWYDQNMHLELTLQTDAYEVVIGLDLPKGEAMPKWLHDRHIYVDFKDMQLYINGTPYKATGIQQTQPERPLIDITSWGSDSREFMV